ncbi:NUDIX domain-containing protein [Streptomyces sp. NPDC015125]|uniref:NUDIX domain-containing protein n=1 Tax=Streptomyces sp. NPDC015125 TaxID=3364938 RepID=UPI0036F5B2AE
MVATTILVAAPQDHVLLTDTNARGHLELPGGLARSHEAPEAAAERILRDTLGPLGLALPTGRLLGIDRAGRATGSVITHIFATSPLTQDQARSAERHARGTVRILPTARVRFLLPSPSRHRAAAGLRALTAGTVAYLGATPHATAAISCSAVITDPHGRLLIVRNGTTDTWRLPGGPLDTATGEGPQRAAQRFAHQAIDQPLLLDKLLCIDWCHHPSHAAAQVHYLYGASSSALPQSALHGSLQAEFIDPGEIATTLAPREARRAQACLNTHAARSGSGALELHNGYRDTRLLPSSSAREHSCTPPTQHGKSTSRVPAETTSTHTRVAEEPRR